MWYLAGPHKAPTGACLLSLTQVCHMIELCVSCTDASHQQLHAENTCCQPCVPARQLPTWLSWPGRPCNGWLKEGFANDIS